MKIEKAKIEDLISPEYNPRDITPDEMEKLKTSIQEFGYVDPIIVNEHNNHIVGGNQRYEALKSLEYTEVDVVYINETDPNREKALNIALNKISGEWDNEKLTQIFEEFRFEGFDTDLTGFDEYELPTTSTFFDDNFDDSDIEEGGIDENFDSTFKEQDTYIQEATFELHQNDSYDFGAFEITIKEKFANNNVKLNIYQDTMRITLDNLADEDLLKEFIEKNGRENLRDNGKLKSDIYG